MLRSVSFVVAVHTRFHVTAVMGAALNVNMVVAIVHTSTSDVYLSVFGVLWLCTFAHFIEVLSWF